MASPNSTFTDLVTTTLRDHPSVVSDNVSGKNMLYNRLLKRNKMRREVGGGYKIVQPLEFAENGSFQRYSGLDPLNIELNETMTAAEYDWVQSAVSVVASGRDLRANSGKAQIINLMKSRTKGALHTAANNMSIDLYSTGSLTNQMGGLGHIIQTNGQGTVGGIPSATYTFWRNKFKEAAGTGPSYTDLKADMHALWLDTANGTDVVDLVLSTQDLYSVYWDQLSDVQRYRALDDVPDTFQALKFQGADVVYDNNSNFTATGEKMFFVNTNHIELVYHPDANWTPLEETRPVNQDGAIVTMIWQGQLITDNRSRLGVLIDAS